MSSIPHIVLLLILAQISGCAFPPTEHKSVSVKQKVTCEAGCTVEQSAEREGESAGSTNITVTPVP